MNVFDIILSPFIFLIKQLILLGYALTNDYGLAIIFLSFSISVILLPVFILIEKAKRKDDALKLNMKPLIDEIKRCYKGQERYYYLKTIHRQHNYSPVRALIPILSLLLQIPFFIAAYQFLEGFEPLRGVSFLFINDLNAPDGLLGKINILPITMTVVNLLTAYFYTRHGNSGERKQMLVVAGIFLVLLFKLPSGLVLYWTMNNVFSFFRLFITNPEVFKKVKNPDRHSVFAFTEIKTRLKPLFPKLKVTFVVLLVLGMLSQLNWAFSNYFDGFAIRIIGAVFGSLILTLLVAILVVFHRVDISIKNTEIKTVLQYLWQVFKPLYIILVSLVIIFQINWAIQNNFDDFLLRIFGSFIGSGLTIGLLAFITLAYQKKITFETGRINLKILSVRRIYFISFLLLATIAIAAQINWAINFNFNDIVARIIVAIFGSWIAIVIVSHISEKLIKDKRFSIQIFREKFNQLFVKSWYIFAIIVLLAIISQFIWGLQNNYNGFVFRLVVSLMGGLFFSFIIASLLTLLSIINFSIKNIEIKPVLFYSLLFLTIYFFIAAKYYYLGVDKALSTFAFIFLLPTQFLAALYFYRYNNARSSRVHQGIGILLLIIAGLELLSILALNSNNELNKTILNINLHITAGNLTDIVFFGIIYSLIVLPFYIWQNRVRDTFRIKNSWVIYILAILYIIGFVFLWNPLAIYSSYPSNFDFPAIDILKNNFTLFSITFALFFLLFVLIPKRWKWIWLVILLTTVVVSFLHNTVMPINVGSLQEGKFLNQDNLAQPKLLYLLESLMIISVVLLIRWILLKNYTKLITIALILLNITLISQSLYESMNTGVFFKKPQIQTDSSGNISFSKNKENVVVVIADMFHGWYMDRILKEAPGLKKDLEGFVWYPNTLSISSITASSIGPIIGGYNNTIEKLNNDSERTIEEKITEISEDFFQKVKNKGFDFTSTHFIYSTIDENKFKTFIPKWHKSWDHWNNELNIGLSKEIGYKLLWENATFYSAPLFLKSKIYSNGNWMHGEVETNENTAKTKPYNLVRILPYISDISSSEPNFIFLHTYASHHPWDIIDENGKLITDVSPYENNKWTIETFVNWLKWMKQNGVYDNTKIIIVSDHGPHWRSAKGKVDYDIPVVNSTDSEINIKEIMVQFALLLVKDFNEADEFKIDNRFMSNADVSAIAFDENNPLKEAPQSDRILPATVVTWERKLWYKKELEIRQKFEVKNNMFDLSNWSRINEN